MVWVNTQESVQGRVGGIPLKSQVQSDEETSNETICYSGSDSSDRRCGKSWSGWRWRRGLPMHLLECYADFGVVVRALQFWKGLRANHQVTKTHRRSQRDTCQRGRGQVRLSTWSQWGTGIRNRPGGTRHHSTGSRWRCLRHQPGCRFFSNDRCAACRPAPERRPRGGRRSASWKSPIPSMPGGPGPGLSRRPRSRGGIQEASWRRYIHGNRGGQPFCVLESGAACHRGRQVRSIKPY